MNESIKKFLTGKGIKAPREIKWAHAVNDVKYLEKVLSDPNVDFLEVDIGLSKSGEPIAAHYADKSDLTIEYLLNSIKLSGKGLKLDFKDKAALISTLEKLQKRKLSQPIILNADVLSAEHATSADTEPEWFIKNCQEYYPTGLLSLGWRTAEASVYSEDDINTMLNVCKDLEVATFPIRASSLPESWHNVKRLIEKNGYTLTIWNGGILDTELKEWIMKNTDEDRCFYDLEL